MTVPSLLNSLQRVLYSDDVPVIPQAVILPTPNEAIEAAVNISDEQPPLIISSPVLPAQGASPSRKPSYATFSPGLKSPLKSPKVDQGKHLEKHVSLWTLDDAEKLPALPSQLFSQNSLTSLDEQSRMKQLMSEEDVF
jgi:hypothetical protein